MPVYRDPLTSTTARVSAAHADQQRRQERAADATAYLNRTGHTDLLAVLGLADPTCEHCGNPYQARPGDHGHCKAKGCQRALRQPAADRKAAA